jgi:hypothetical protein
MLMKSFNQAHQACTNIQAGLVVRNACHNCPMMLRILQLTAGPLFLRKYATEVEAANLLCAKSP